MIKKRVKSQKLLKWKC